MTLLEQEDLGEIFRLKFIEGFSLRQISSELKFHRNTVKKYVDIMEGNLNELKASLITEGKYSADGFDSFIKLHWENYLDRITYFTHTRIKRVATKEVVNGVLKLSKILNTTRAKVIYDHIQKRYQETGLASVSYSTIWRILRDSNR